MEPNYQRNAYGELFPKKTSYEIWQLALTLIAKAEKAKKLPTAYDTIDFDYKSGASGTATHHEIYDIHPNPFRVLICVRKTAGSKYGVSTLSKTYYILRRHGRGVRVVEASKTKAAKAAKASGCELGCAINVVEGKTKLSVNRACPDGIAYKQLAVGDDGQLYSIYDGSPWKIGHTRHDQAMRDHNGGLYVYETADQAKNAQFPYGSKLIDNPRVVVQMRVAGNYCRYGKKLAFSYVTPIIKIDC